MNNDRLINKIKSLFALAACEGATGAESENALRMANKLLEKHAISEMDLVNKENVTVDFYSYPDKKWIRDIFNGVSHLYNCKFVLDNCWSEPKFLVIGSQSNVTTAGIVCAHLIDQIRTDSKGKRDAFRNGAAQSVYFLCATIIKERKESTEEVVTGTGLVPLDIIKKAKSDVDGWLSNNMPNLVADKRKGKSSQEGREYGKGLNVGARVQGAGQKRLA